MDSDEPTSAVKIEIDVAEEMPVSWWTEKDHQGQGGTMVSLSLPYTLVSCSC